MAVSGKRISPFPKAGRYDPQMTPNPPAAPVHVLPITLDVVDDHTWPLDLAFRYVRTGELATLTNWGCRLTVRRKIDGATIVDATEAMSAISLVNADTTFRIQIWKTLTDLELVVPAFPTLRPWEREALIYDIEVTPDAWDIQTTVRPFVAMGGRLWVARDTRP